MPQIGDFGLVRMNGDSGRLIRFGQWLNGEGFADYEHAFIYVGGDQIIEAEPSGAKPSPVSEYKDILWSTGWFPWITSAQRTEIALTALGLKGTPYSFADYAAIAAHTLHIPGNNLLKRYVASSEHMICSQLVDYCYRQAGVELFPGRWPGYVTPASLYGLRPKANA